MKISKDDLASYSPIDFYGLKIYKHTLQEIGNIGFSEFSKYNAMLLITTEDLELLQQKQQENNSLESLIPITTNPFDYILQTSKNPIYFLELRLAFFTYLKRDIKIFKNNIVILSNDKETSDFLLDEFKFGEFQNSIRQLNCLEIDEDYEIQNDNEELKRKFYEARKKLKKAKAKKKITEKDKNSLNLSDMRFALCSMYGGYTYKDTESLTVYQLFTQFKMCRARETFLLNHRAKCAGTKIQLHDWIKMD